MLAKGTYRFKVGKEYQKVQGWQIVPKVQGWKKEPKGPKGNKSSRFSKCTLRFKVGKGYL